MPIAATCCAVRQWKKTDTERGQAIFAAAFGEHGMPEVIRSDNGTPFAARAVNGFSCGG